MLLLADGPSARAGCGGGANGPAFVEVFYGAAKCGAIFTAVNNQLARREVLAMLADAQPRTLVADDGDVTAYPRQR